VGGELQVGLGFGYDGRGVVLQVVNAGEKDVDVGLLGIEPHSFQGAVLRLGDAAERELHECQTVFADGGIGSDKETSLNEELGLAVVCALIKDHGEAEYGRREASVGEVNGFLEIFGGGIELAEAEEGQAEIVIGAIGVRGLFNNLAEVGEAGFEIAFEEELCALCKGLRGFAGHGEILNGDDGIVARSGCNCGFAQMEDERSSGGKAGGELEHLAGGSGDGNEIGCSGELVESKLAVVIGERGYGGTGVRDEEFNERLGDGAVVTRKKNGARGGRGRAWEGRRLRETHGG